MKKQIGIYACHCGTNIAATVDCQGLARFFQSSPGGKIARDYQYLCSDPGQDLIKNDIRELGINRVVIAACSPRMHEATFRNALALKQARIGRQITADAGDQKTGRTCCELVNPPPL